MKKINKNLFIFSFITSFFIISLAIIVYKFIPAIFTHTVYYCQLLINSYSIRIPHELNLFVAALIFLIILVLLAKIFVVFVKILQTRNSLIKNETEIGSIKKLIDKTGLNNKVSIINDSRLFAFCAGVRDPHIYISSKTVAMMTERQLQAILLHEKYHLEHLDSLTLLIGSLPQLLFPFFPLLQRLLEHYKIESEIKADKRAISKLGRKPVIEVLEKLLKNPSVSPVFVSRIADANTLEIRIQSLFNKKTQHRRIGKADFLISIISLSVILLSLAAPIHAVEIHKGKSDTMMVCLENNTCAKWCEEHNTVIPYKQNMSYPYSSAR